MHVDEVNRAKLQEWVKGKLKEYDENPTTRTKRDVKHYCRNSYRMFLEKSAAEKLIESQRMRAGKHSIQVSLESNTWWVPEGLEVRKTTAYGYAMFTTRSFKRFDCLLVEEPLAVVNSQGKRVMSEDNGEILHEMWQTELDAFHALPPSSQYKLLSMYAVPRSSLPSHLQHHLETFVNSCAGSTASPTPPNETQDALEVRERVPLVWLSNACEVSEERHALPRLASLFSHACNPNAARIPEPDGSSVEVIARRDLAAGEMLTLDYLGGQLWGRRERQSSLQESKCFECACERCSRPDWEGALPCPLCWPLSARQGGFAAVLPPGSTAPPFGFMVQHPKGPGKDDGGEWACTVCTERLNQKEMEMPLPAGSPAPTYLGLAMYAEDLIRAGLSEPECLNMHHVTTLLEPLRLTVGERHWTFKWLTMLKLQLTHDPQVVEDCLGEMCGWLEEWTRLEPSRILGVKTIMDAAGKLFQSGRFAQAFKYYSFVAENVPLYSPVFQVVIDKIRQCHQRGV